ncbi:MAG: sulfotransferase, partial [Gammaproteobacteria bacterium]|nr:sulfotransferase [Gammaproteobacteria bacterium]
QTHREPVEFMGSWCSLVEGFRADISEPRPRRELSAEQLKAMSRMLDRAVDFRDSHPELEDRWIDVSYYDLVQDPMAVVAHIYDRRGWSLEHETAAAMEAWLDELLERRRTEKRHRYDIADYGLTREMIDAAFVRYREFVSERGIRES